MNYQTKSCTTDFKGHDTKGCKICGIAVESKVPNGQDVPSQNTAKSNSFTFTLFG
jgi:hypothetical protein